MTKWLQWMVLTSITGSPLGSVAILLVVWWTVDRFTFHVLPDPVRGLLRWKRVLRLRQTITDNPNDRRARFELADLYVQQRRFTQAMTVLRPNIEAGDDDAATLFTFGRAAAGAKQWDQAARMFDAVKEDEPGFRQGDIDLELGRLRLARGDLDGAEKALRDLITRRRSTVEGRVLLARVFAQRNDATGAKKLRDEAWTEYVGTPASHRRRERLWAWRARPTRPLAYLAIAFVCASTVAWTASKVELPTTPPFDGALDAEMTPEPPAEQ
ncbi:tetratricopeptide repeat protein [Myxococcota bacterium]|nr:tetratricopeptide repeat protein [Myxococcota bacterium]